MKFRKEILQKFQHILNLHMKCNNCTWYSSQVTLQFQHIMSNFFYYTAIFIFGKMFKIGNLILKQSITKQNWMLINFVYLPFKKYAISHYNVWIWKLTFLKSQNTPSNMFLLISWSSYKHEYLIFHQFFTDYFQL